MIGQSERLAVWAGGIWSWLDPLTAIRAIERLQPSRPDLKLAFVAYDHPDPNQRPAHAGLVAQAIDYTRSHGLGDTVLFRPRWLGYGEYLGQLRDADVGISLHGRTLEGLYAARTRVLDYLAAELPVVCSRGDTMADLVAANDAGKVVDPLDVGGCAAALDTLTRGAPRRVDVGFLDALRWRIVAEPLVEYCLDPGPAVPRPATAVLGEGARVYPAFLAALYRLGGAGELARGVRRRASRSLGPLRSKRP